MPIKMTCLLCLIGLASNCGGGVDRTSQTETGGEEVALAGGPECVAEDADSSARVRAAVAAANEAIGNKSEFLDLRVRVFEARTGGTLVTLLPGRPNVLGGGARVWVPKRGCAVVRELIE